MKFSTERTVAVDSLVINGGIVLKEKTENEKLKRKNLAERQKGRKKERYTFWKNVFYRIHPKREKKLHFGKKEIDNSFSNRKVMLHKKQLKSEDTTRMMYCQNKI